MHYSPAMTSGESSSGEQSKRLRRTPLRDEVYRILVGKVTAGELPPGARLSDVSVAEELGVSRTPVRETLLRLEREGFLEADHHRGFFVRGFDEREIRETYPLVWALETLALRLAFPLPEETVPRLRALNRSMKAVRATPSELTRLDLQWHSALVAGCGNSRLLGILGPLKSSIERYEHGYMRTRNDVMASTREHDAIAESAAAGDVQSAASLLEAHWRRGMEALFERQG